MVKIKISCCYENGYGGDVGDGGTVSCGGDVAGGGYAGAVGVAVLGLRRGVGVTVGISVGNGVGVNNGPDCTSLPSNPSKISYGGAFSGCSSKRARSNHCTTYCWPPLTTSIWGSLNGNPNSAKFSGSLLP